MATIGLPLLLPSSPYLLELGCILRLRRPLQLRLSIQRCLVLLLFFFLLLFFSLVLVLVLHLHLHGNVRGGLPFPLIVLWRFILVIFSLVT